MKSWYTTLATFGPVGYTALPGTMGSLVSMVAIYFLHIWNVSIVPYSVLVGLSFFGSVYIINRTLRKWHRNDDASEIVIDEFVGVLFTFWFVKVTLGWAVVGFFLFRVFDITKVGTQWLEKIPGGLGIVLDDVGAGILSNVVLQIFIHYS